MSRSLLVWDIEHLAMGSCFSSESAGDPDQKKRSQMIDRKLEEDSRRLRRECKILLLGMPSSVPDGACFEGS